MSFAMNLPNIKGSHMSKRLDNSRCPELPEWLEETARLINKDQALVKDTPKYILELYALYQRANNGCVSSAEKLAVHYEVGSIPAGADVGIAVEWHKYAVELNSASSAMRLAELLLWMGENENSLTMARAALTITLEGKFRAYDDWCNAGAAALFLLDRTPNQEDRGLIEDLISCDKFTKHPDAGRIASQLRRINCQSGDEKLSLKVAQSKIIEDGDYKAGIYKCLEKPLPLVPVTSNPEEIRNVLNKEFPWFHQVNELVYRQMVVAQLSATPAFHIRPLLLAGLPGVGKTTWAKRLAELCQVPFRTVMAGGGADAMFLKGLSRGWSSARPGAVIQAMAIEGVANPLFLIDELEKSSADSRNGRIWDVLLQMLEPASSKTYLDECLQVPCDLSMVSWIATVNELGSLPKPLLDRFTVVLVEPPDDSHFMTIVEGSLRSFALELDIDLRMLKILDGDDYDVLRRCKNPREINRTVRMIIEDGLVKTRQGMRH
jgi:hypothetical protein